MITFLDFVVQNYVTVQLLTKNRKEQLPSG